MIDLETPPKKMPHLDIELTREQLDFLDSRGGRNVNDVGKDEKGLFIWMGVGYRKHAKVYLVEEIKRTKFKSNSNFPNEKISTAEDSEDTDAL